jgi:hypothetical protein
MSKGSVDMEQSKVKKILDQCLKEPFNRVCAECAQKRPLWASSNLGVFVCIRCRSVRGAERGGGERRVRWMGQVTKGEVRASQRRLILLLLCACTVLPLSLLSLSVAVASTAIWAFTSRR